MKLRLSLAWMLMWMPVVAAAQAPPAPGVGVPDIQFERTPPYREQVSQQGRVLALGVADVVQRAVANNLDILVERYNQAIVQQRIAAAEGFYDPSLTWTTSMNDATNPLAAASGAFGIPSEHVATTALGPAIRQNLFTGATVNVGLASNRTFTSNANALMTPTFGSSVTASVTQPLLRGLVRTTANRQVDLVRLDAAIARSQYRQKVTQVLQQVLLQFWELVFAIENYEVRRQSKDLALLQYDSTQVRVQNGLLAPVALTASRAEIASRERDLLQVEVQIINAENNLKQLLAEDPASEIWEAAVLPTGAPAGEPPPLSLTAAQTLARERRPEIEQLRVQQSQNRVDATFLRWETRPTVNLSAAFTSSGRAGTVLQRTADGRTPDFTNPAFGGFQTSWRQAFDVNFPTWNVNLSVQMPIRNRTAGAQLAQAALAGNRLGTQLTKTTQAVNVDVRNAFQVIATQRKSLEAARLTTQLFEEQLEVQTARYQAGFSTDFELLRYQRDLIDARVRELRAAIDLQQGIISLQRATDTLLDDLGVVVPR